MGNIFVQITAQHCCIGSRKALLLVLPPRAQLATQQISVLQVAPYVTQSRPEFYFLQQFFFNL